MFENAMALLVGFGVFAPAAASIYGLVRAMYGGMGKWAGAHGGVPERIVALNGHIIWGFCYGIGGLLVLFVCKSVKGAALLVGTLGLALVLVAFFYVMRDSLREHLSMSRLLRRERTRRRVAELERDIFGQEEN